MSTATVTFSSGFKRPNRSDSLSILHTKQNIVYHPNKILQTPRKQNKLKTAQNLTCTLSSLNMGTFL
jgi:hypothetical protein